MKVTEFRIGNYYMPTDGSIIFFETVTADDIAAWDSGAIYGKPSPITEKSLLKLGFSKQSIGYSKLTEMRELFDISFGKHTQINSISFNNDIKYVHQLQNLYFALTGEELKQQ